MLAGWWFYYHTLRIYIQHMDFELAGDGERYNIYSLTKKLTNTKNKLYVYIYITIYGWLFFASSFGYPKPQLGRCPLSKSSAGLHVRRGTQAGQPGIFTSPWSFRTALGARAIFIGRGHEGPKVLAILREENMRKTRFTDVYTMTHSWLRGLNGLNIKITNGGQLLMRTHPILGTNHDKNIC